MAKAKKNIKRGVTLYNKILKEFTSINRQLPEDRRLSLADRRKYIKERIYPQYKGTPSSRVGKRAISMSIFQVLDTLAPQEECNPNYISPSDTSDIAWFELDDYIKDVLPKCIYIRIDGGKYGKTKIFNTMNYNYTQSGVKGIVDNIREFVNNDTQVDVSLTGIKKLKRGKTNDGTPDNYYIDFILVINSEPIKELQPIVFDVPKEEKKVVKSVKKAILERVKQLSLKKKRRINARKSAIKSINKVRTYNKRLKRTTNTQNKSKLKYQRLKEYLKTQKQLEVAFRKGNLTQEQYDRFMAEVNKVIEQVKRDGGIV